MNAMKSFRREDGSVTIWMLGLCVMVLFLGGISLDLWRAFAERRALAARVDSAAVAGGSGIDEAVFRRDGVVQLDPQRADSLARANLDAQPGDPSLLGQTVSASPASITVTARGQVHFTLLSVLIAGKPFMINVSATVRPEAGGP